MTKLPPITRRTVIRGGAAAAAALALGRVVPARAAGAALNFLALGDWGAGNEAQRKVAAGMAKVAADAGCDFIISTGDNIYPRGVESARDPQWKTKFEDVYAAPSLQVPWHVVLGNHDYDGDEQAQIEYSKINPRWRMPAHYFKHTERLADGSEIDFFFTDTHPIRRAYRNWVRFVYFPPGEQVAWLERGLAASNAAWKIVVGHHPVYSGGTHNNTDGLIERFKPLFDRHGVQAYLNGHNHNLEHVVVDGVHYLTSGGGSEPTPVKPVANQRFAHSGLGFLRARLTRDELEIEFLDESAKPLHRAAIARDRGAGRAARRLPERVAG